MHHLRTRYFLFFGACITFSSYSYAACIQNPNLRNVQSNLPNTVYTIQHDDMSTRLLGEFKINYKNQPITTHSGDNNGQCGNASIAGYYTNGWVPNANKIVQTNIPGIGMEIYLNSLGLINLTWSSNGGNLNKYLIVNPQWTVRILKTGRVTGSGSLKQGELARMVQYNTAPNNSTWNLASLYIPANSIRINVVKCSLKSSSYNVKLGTWYDTQFKNIGDVSNNIDIPITLSCMAGTNIKTTVTSGAGYIDVNTGKLKLSGVNSATGLGIQLLDKNSYPIKLNTKNNLQNQVASGDYIFGWKARYIKTSNTITPGSANSYATVNILYE